ncbi:RDD family protein [Campylobacter sp. US33a]|uniref:RDD family protein n=1 Tax=Campylobacter sp. CCS1377 TaxID=3158229 RepID=A0AAU7E9J6_9BACT|nr:RDD family protein [Campylobacter sp. US33a]MCW1360884.1 RDD family protein [Campylobacter jejuni]TEY00536.1 RDD family protein [Campylobacter sp. US33a]
MKESILDRLERENLSLASFPKRIVAFILDNIILSLVVIVMMFDKIEFQTPEDFAFNLQKYSFFIMLLQFFYHTLFVYLYGASLGKMICKIQVIDEVMLDKPNLMQSIFRAAGKQLSEMLFMLGYVWAFGNQERKTWQDYFAKTVVIDVA